VHNCKFKWNMKIAINFHDAWVTKFFLSQLQYCLVCIKLHHIKYVYNSNIVWLHLNAFNFNKCFVHSHLFRTILIIMIMVIIYTTFFSHIFTSTPCCIYLLLLLFFVCSRKKAIINFFYHLHVDIAENKHNNED
jgi:hypothetical protein